MKASEAQQMEKEFKSGLQKLLSTQGTLFSSIVATGLYHTVCKLFDDSIAGKVIPEQANPVGGSNEKSEAEA